jgi:hypothetical protein
LLNILYPTESFFYPYHLLAGVIASGIFFVILICLFRFKGTHKKAAEKTWGFFSTDQTKLGIGIDDAISMASLIIALVASGLYPFLINPMMDYTVNYVGDVKPNIQEYRIDITNWGLSPANNVILSMTSDNTNFFNFTIQPFLGNLTRSNISVQGNAMFWLPVLPPRSHSLIEFKADVTHANSAQQLTMFARSDERVGYHDVVWTIIFYLILGIIMVLLFIILVFRKKREKKILTLKKIGLSFIPISAWVIGFTVVYLIVLRNAEHLANL